MIIKSKKKELTPQYLTGKILLATPAITDPRFQRAVIFMCAHDDKGAMGFMINNILRDVEFEKIIEQTGLKSNIKIDLKEIGVLNGGPVEESRGFLLHSNEFKQKETIQVNQQFGVTGTVEALQDVVEGKGPKDMLFVLGHAGWSAGQLDQEIQQNSWLIAEPNHKLIFDTPLEEKWTFALSTLGIDPAMLSMNAGRA